MEPSTDSRVVRRKCINCDNRHGCRTPQPLCLTLTREPSERRSSGKALMASRGLLARCRGCGLFRQCWTESRYREQMK